MDTGTWMDYSSSLQLRLLAAVWHVVARAREPDYRKNECKQKENRERYAADRESASRQLRGRAQELDPPARLRRIRVLLFHRRPARAHERLRRYERSEERRVGK